MQFLDWEEIYRHLRRDPDDEIAWHSLQQQVLLWARHGVSGRGERVVDEVAWVTCGDIFVGLEQARGDLTFRGFCYGKYLNARRRVLRWYRLGNFNWPLTGSEEDIPAPPGSEEGDCPSETQLALLRRCVERLQEQHEREWRAVELQFFGERTPAEVANKLGVNENYSRLIVYRGLAHLKVCLGGTHHGQQAN